MENQTTVVTINRGQAKCLAPRQEQAASGVPEAKVRGQLASVVGMTIARRGIGAIAVLGLALAALGCNSCSSTPEAKEPPAVEVPSAESSVSAAPTADPAQERATGGCVIGGCSGELCHPPEMPEMATVCQHKPEWDCYRDALCGRNEQNQCDWVMTPELEKCLKVASKRGGGEIH